MPLNILWGLSAFDLVHRKVGWKIIVLWVVAALSLLVASMAVFGWLCESRRQARKQLKHQVILNMEVRLARTICFFPLHICVMACVCLIFPSTAYSLELVMAIAASVVMACLVQYYLMALGGGRAGRASAQLLEKTPQKKWWMASYCGGVNDMLPGMGFVYSRQPHSLELPDIHRAVKLVELFMWIYISTSALQVALSVIPTSVHKDEDGWCVEAAVVSPGISTAILICQVLSTFVGSAGFSIISSATDEVYKAVDPDNDYNFKRKAVTGGCYLQLPLVKVWILDRETVV
ncbi:unnamed protein product [Durusdinium trenchii]|uniref:Uncharacterized protein n=2 Tax=Durusdinium trenchii TaxID=1381693 RepID=A0ABP0JMS9_9DINO